MSDHPRVALVALGGTIASLPTGQDGGATPALLADDMVAAVPGLAEVADVQTQQLVQVPSCDVTLADLVLLVDTAREAVLAGATGVVVTHGTDTLEESAFVVDLLWDRPEPLVFTGALRIPTTPGADGAGNVLAAVRVAAAASARELGVLVCLGDEVHAARRVRKTHTSSAAAFTSPGVGPIGWLSEGRLVLAARPVRTGAHLRAHDVRRGLDPAPRVALVRVGLGDDGTLLAAVAGPGADGRGFDGVVVEGVGGGHVPSRIAPIVSELADAMPVLLASRTGAGAVLTHSYGYPGGDIDLVARGALPTGTLDGAKARLVLVLALAAGHDRAGVASLLAELDPSLV